MFVLHIIQSFDTRVDLKLGYQIYAELIYFFKL